MKRYDYTAPDPALPAVNASRVVHVRLRNLSHPNPEAKPNAVCLVEHGRWDGTEFTVVRKSTDIVYLTEEAADTLHNALLTRLAAQGDLPDGSVS